MLNSLLGGESTELDLSQLFGSLVQSLTQNKDHLNSLDEHNGDHGDNIVKIFEVAADAMAKRQGASPMRRYHMQPRKFASCLADRLKCTR